MTPQRLTPREFRRLVAKMGGLWSPSQLGHTCGSRVRHDATHRTFPEAVWEVGRTRLYAGWDVVDWLLSQERWTEAELLQGELSTMERSKFEQTA